MKLLTELDSLDNVKDGETRKLITKTTSSGSGNVVSSVSVSGDTITYTKGVTALTAHQNAFSNVKVGSTTVAADKAGDTLELVAGSNVTLTPDATNDKVTIAATDTTYTVATGENNGQIKVTPSSGNAYNVNVKGLNALAYKKLELMTTNPFSPADMTGLYVSKIDNAFYALNKRYEISWERTTTEGAVTTGTSNVEKLFDGNYDNQFQISNGDTYKFLLKFGENGGTSYFPGYPYGNILVSFYHTSKPASVSARGYCNWASQGVGWKTLPVTDVSENASHNCWKIRNDYYNISQFEITVVGDTTNAAGATAITQIEMHLDRPAPQRNPFVTKYNAETLYYDLTAPNFIGNLTGTATKATGDKNGNDITTTYYKASNPNGFVTTDTKNTAGSTNSTSKIYLIGATEQSANPQTYSNSAIYGTNGELIAGSFGMMGANNLKAGFRMTQGGGTARDNMDIGWDWNSIAGSGAALRSSGAGGSFIFFARKNNEGTAQTSQLQGTPAGSLTWAGNEVVRGASKGDTNTPVYINSSGIATACASVNATGDKNGDDITTTYYKASNPNGYTTNVGTITGVSVNGTSVSTNGVANITNVPASILSGAIPSTITATTQEQADNSTKLATTAFVKTAIDNLPEPMVFKGSLGTGGTITALPVDGTATVGDTYKVITAGTYASKAAKVGDTFICLTKTSSANTWELIPSGDEPSGTVTSITIKATSPIAIDSSSAITTSGTRTLSHANSGVTAGTYRSVTVNATGHVTAGSNPTTLGGYGITDAKIASGVITLGSNTITPLTSTSLTNENLNNITTPGLYYAGGSNSTTNKPSNVDAYGLKVFKTAGGYITQELVEGNTTPGKRWTRQYNGSTWSSWAEMKWTDTDTKNTAGSTDTSSKIFLIGATSQAANPQTYSDNEVYATSGVLTTKSVQVGGTAATIQYNSTDKCIEFIFA